MENYRYIKSTAEATIPNFIFQKSPLWSQLFMAPRFFGGKSAYYSKYTTKNRQFQRQSPHKSGSLSNRNGQDFHAVHPAQA